LLAIRTTRKGTQARRSANAALRQAVDAWAADEGSSCRVYERLVEGPGCVEELFPVGGRATLDWLTEAVAAESARASRGGRRAPPAASDTEEAAAGEREEPETGDVPADGRAALRSGEAVRGGQGAAEAVEKASGSPGARLHETWLRHVEPLGALVRSRVEVFCPGLGHKLRCDLGGDCEALACTRLKKRSGPKQREVDAVAAASLQRAVDIWMTDRGHRCRVYERIGGGPTCVSELFPVP